MLSPCWVVAGLSIAPEPSARIFRKGPESIGRKWAASTDAMQPQPLPGVGVLLRRVERRAAVAEPVGKKGHAPLGHQVHQKLTADAAQIPGDDVVVRLRTAPRILKVGGHRIRHGRGHRRAHVVGVLDLIVHDAARRAVRQAAQAFFAPGHQRRAGGVAVHWAEGGR